MTEENVSSVLGALCHCDWWSARGRTYLVGLSKKDCKCNLYCSCDADTERDVGARTAQ
jgi:hypothetical protein